MPGFCGAVGEFSREPRQLAAAVETLDRLGSCDRRVVDQPDLRLAVAPLTAAPLPGPYLHEDEELVGGFAGDLIDQERVPWDRITADLRRGSLDWLEDCDGHFAAALYHKPQRTFYLVGDHFAYRPLFSYRTRRGLLFGTNLPALLHLGAEAGLDEKWLHQYMYFGYWPGQATFLRGARRLPPASVLVYDAGANREELRTYSERFRKVVPPRQGRDAIEHAKTVFQDRTPRYFGRGEPVEFALSGGLDTRTLLAYLPPHAEHAAFTYGVPGSPDQREAALVARSLDLPHRIIPFDAAFEPSLSRLIYEVVWLSGGLAWIHRAMLPHVYRDLDRYRPRTPIVMSGISLDILFRGHNNARGDLDRFLATGEIQFTNPHYAQIFGDRMEEFRADNRALGEALNREHGGLENSEGYLNYLVYTLLPSYFSADLEIGGHHGMLRVPGWDRAIIRLAYEIEYSTIYLSKFLPHERFKEFVLQAHLMSTDPDVARIPLHGIPLWVWTKENRFAYHTLRWLKHGPRYLKRRFLKGLAEAPLENWDRWFATRLLPELRNILHEKSLVAEYVDPACFEPLLETNDWNWTARLATVELLLQLMNNGWDLEALPYPGVQAGRG